MKALEVHAVVHHGEARWRHGVERRDLGGPALRDRDDLGRAREHAAFEAEDDPVVETAPAAAAEAREVGAVAALPRAVHVLAERALVALDDVPRAARHRQASHRRKRERARGRREAWQRECVLRDPRHRVLAAGCQQVHGVSVLDQRPDEPGGDPLDAAVEDEGAGDDQELHGRASRRSISGNSAALAARKL